MVNSSKLSSYGFDGSDELLGHFRNFIGRFAAARQAPPAPTATQPSRIHSPALST